MAYNEDDFNKLYQYVKEEVYFDNPKALKGVKFKVAYLGTITIDGEFRFVLELKDGLDDNYMREFISYLNNLGIKCEMNRYSKYHSDNIRKKLYQNKSFYLFVSLCDVNNYNGLVNFLNSIYNLKRQFRRYKKNKDRDIKNLKLIIDDSNKKLSHENINKNVRW